MKLWTEMTATVSTLETALTAAQASIVTLQSGLATAQADIVALQADIVTLQGVDTSQQAGIDANTAKFAAIAAVTGPTGGVVIDSESRTAIDAIIAAS